MPVPVRFFSENKTSLVVEQRLRGLEMRNLSVGTKFYSTLIVPLTCTKPQRTSIFSFCLHHESSLYGRDRTLDLQSRATPFMSLGPSFACVHEREMTWQTIAGKMEQKREAGDDRSLFFFFFSPTLHVSVPICPTFRPEPDSLNYIGPFSAC